MLERYRGSNEKVYMNIDRLKKIVRKKKKKRITVTYIFCVSGNFFDFIFCNFAGDSSDVFIYANYPTTSIMIGTACDADEIADFERFSYSVPRYMMKTFFRNIHFGVAGFDGRDISILVEWEDNDVFVFKKDPFSGARQAGKRDMGMFALRKHIVELPRNFADLCID